MEIRGVYYLLLKKTFPLIADIVGPELGRYFEDIDADGWYDAGPYLETVKYLKEHISPEVMELVGSELAAMVEDKIRALGINTPQDLATKVAEIFGTMVRGEDAGSWEISNYQTSRCILTETGPTRDTSFVAGIVRGGLGAVGAYNIRITVLEDRANGAAANKYLIEWMEPKGE